MSADAITVAADPAPPGYRFRSRRTAGAYQLSSMSIAVLVIAMLAPLSPVRWLAWGVAGAGAVVNQILFFRAAHLGGTASPSMLNGVATRAGRACWRAAGQCRRGEPQGDRPSGPAPVPDPQAVGQEPRAARARHRTGWRSGLFIGLTVVLLVVLAAVLLAAIARPTVTTVNVADLPAGTPWHALVQSDGRLGPPTVDCPSLASWVGGDRPAVCGADVRTAAIIVGLAVLTGAGAGAALVNLVRQRQRKDGEPPPTVAVRRARGNRPPPP